MKFTKCRQCGQDATITEQRIIYTSVRLPATGKLVTVPAGVVLTLECPKCGPRVQISYASAHPSDSRRSR